MRISRRYLIGSIVACIVSFVLGAAVHEVVVNWHKKRLAVWEMGIALGLMNEDSTLTEATRNEICERFRVPAYLKCRDEIANYLMLDAYSIGREMDTGAAFYLAFSLRQGRAGTIECVLLKQHLAAVPWDDGVRKMIADDCCNGEGSNPSDSGSAKSQKVGRSRAGKPTSVRETQNNQSANPTPTVQKR